MVWTAVTTSIGIRTRLTQGPPTIDQYGVAPGGGIMRVVNYPDRVKYVDGWLVRQAHRIMTQVWSTPCVVVADWTCRGECETCALSSSSKLVTSRESNPANSPIN